MATSQTIPENLAVMFGADVSFNWAADLEQVKLASRCSSADEEVFGEEKTLPLPFLPEREGAQADLAENASLAAGRQLDQRAWGGGERRGAEPTGESGRSWRERREMQTGVGSPCRTKV